MHDNWRAFDHLASVWRGVLQRELRDESVGNQSGLVWGEEEDIGALVKWDRVEETVNRPRGGGEAGEDHEEKGELAKSAVVKSGSLDVKMGRLVEELVNLKKDKLRNKKNIGEIQDHE